MATTKARQDLRSKFVRNAIPTEQDFKDLIDAQLNQKDDGIFRSNPAEPLSIVAGSDPQKRSLRFYSDDTGGAPDWLISLNPGQDPNDAATNRRGFGIANGTGATRLYLDESGNLGLGTNAPQAKLHVSGGGALIDGGLSVAGAITASAAVTVGGQFTASGRVALGKEDGSLEVVIKGAVHAARSELYFTKTDHNHIGFGNTTGYAAIENAVNFNALMILGRQTTGGRIVKLWDYLEVNGNFKTTGNGDINGSLTIGTTTSALFFRGVPNTPGAGTIRVGDWLLRTNGNVFEIVHAPPARQNVGIGIGGGLATLNLDKIVARFDASQAGAGRLSFP